MMKKRIVFRKKFLPFLLAVLLFVSCIPAQAWGTEAAPPSSANENTALSGGGPGPDAPEEPGPEEFPSPSEPVSSAPDTPDPTPPADSPSSPGPSSSPEPEESLPPPPTDEPTASPLPEEVPTPTPENTPETSPAPSDGPAPTGSPVPVPGAPSLPEATPSPSLSPEPMGPSPSPAPIPNRVAGNLLQAAQELLEALPNEMSPLLLTGRLLYEDEDGEVIPDGADLSLASVLCLEYTFEITEAQAKAIDANPNKQYEIPVPHYLKWGGADVVEELKIPSGERFATLHFSGVSNRAYLEFVNNLDSQFGGIENGVFYLGCALEAAAVGDREFVTVELATGETYPIHITDNQKTDPTLEKSGVYANNRFTWTITYTPGTAPCAAPLTIEDRFDPAVQSYVAGSSSSGEPASSGVEGFTVLTFPVADPAQPLTITYQTRLSDSAVAAGRAVTAKNTASLRDGNAQELDAAAASLAVEGGQMGWIVKTGEYDASNRQIQWTVTVNSLDRDLKDLVLYDKMPDGLNLDAGSVQVNGAALSPGFRLTNAGGTDGGQAYSFSLAFPEPPYEQSYTVSYRTDIDPSYYNGSSSQTFSNQAWVSFGWREYGVGPGYTEHRSPVVGKPVHAAANALQKTGVSYERSTHEITWKVTVNPYQVALQSATLTDDPAAAGQTYVDGSFSLDPAFAGLVTGPTVAADGTLTWEVGDLSQTSPSASPVFTFRTKVDDPLHFSENNPLAGIPYENTISSQNMVIGGGAPIRCTATGKISVLSQVVEKTSGAYDHSTRRITWNVTVNQNKMPMTGVSLLDTLSPGQTYVPDSAIVGGAGVSDADQGISVSGGLLTIPLGDLNGADPGTRQVTLSFQTQLDVNLLPEFLTGETVTVKNTAVLHRDTYRDVSSTGSVQIQNKVLSKSGTLNNADDYIDYRVEINPNRLSFTTLNNRILDQFPAGLLLDLDTVRLYSATVNSDGSLAQGDPCSPGLYRFSYDAAGRALTVELPLDLAEAYVLTYRADIVDRSKKNFENRISFVGDQMGSATGSSKGLSVSGGGGGGLARRKGSLKLVKTDSLDASFPVPGAAFGICNEEGTMVDYGATDENGELLFPALGLGHTYTVKELSAPTGYLPLDSFPVRIDADHRAVELPLTNTRVTGGFSFQKQNDWGLPLSGAEFQLENQAGTPAFLRTAESENGSVEFGQIPCGSYILKETQAPDHHKLDSKEYQVEVTAEGTVSLTENGVERHTLVNVSEKASIRIEKTHASTKEPMAGVEFTVFDSRDTERGRAATDAGGAAEFHGLRVGETYTVRETRVKGFRASPDRTVTLSAEGETLVLKWENKPMPPTAVGSVSITKVDASTGGPLSGVAFEIFDPEGLSWGRGETGENGLLLFSDLPAGTAYTLHETTPEGYLDSPDREIRIDEEQEYAIRWENTPKPQEEPSPSPSPAPSPTPGPEGGGNSQNNGGQGSGTPGGTGQGLSGQTAAAGKKLPQTGRSQLTPYLVLGAGLLLAGAGTAVLRRKKGRHEK